LAGAANVLGAGVGAAVKPIANALATTTTVAVTSKIGVSLTGRSFNVATTTVTDSTSKVASQSVQAVAGEGVSTSAVLVVDKIKEL